MGRRSISSTKTGKFMNPTDQARKEARRKELKKNKKQRLIVRQAVLKGKDPKHLLTEMEALDKMEFDANNPPPYNVKVIQDKRKKLKDTWIKIFQLYEKEEPKQASELKQMEIEYEKRKSQMVAIYESIKQAERVKLEDIPLPDAPMNLLMGSFPTSDIPLPETHQPVTTQITISAPASIQKGILKTKTDSESNAKRKPPGPPPGPPPPLAEFECDDDEKELTTKAEDSLKNKSKKLRFSDENTSELQTTQKSQYPPSSNYTQSLQRSDMAATSLYPPPKAPMAAASSYHTHQPPPPSSTAGYASHYLSQQQQQQQRMPPSQQMSRLMAQQTHPLSQSNVFSAPPSSRPTTASSNSATSQQQAQHASIEDRTPKATTIEAKPQLRNKIAEITRFVPTSLIVKRQDHQKSKSSDNYPYIHHPSSSVPQHAYATPSASIAETKNPKPSTDSAYEAFMKEINKFL